MLQQDCVCVCVCVCQARFLHVEWGLRFQGTLYEYMFRQCVCVDEYFAPPQYNSIQS